MAHDHAGACSDPAFAPSRSPVDGRAPVRFGRPPALVVLPPLPPAFPLTELEEELEAMAELLDERELFDGWLEVRAVLEALWDAAHAWPEERDRVRHVERMAGELPERLRRAGVPLALLER